MDSNFVDLDILITRIREPRSRTYFLDAVKAYKAGALRAALSSAWVAVLYDLLSKYRELSNWGDREATAYLDKWDQATKNKNRVGLVRLESNLISHAASEIQLLDRIAETHLERFREDRNLCAHPAFHTEEELFEPSPEMVRLHFVNAINFVLSQAPLQGKTITDQFDIDIQSAGFPRDSLKIRDYVEQCYLNRTRPQSINNFGIVLAKSLLKGVPLEWEGHRSQVVESLVAVQERASESWPQLSVSILKILNNIEASQRVRGIAFIATFPDFWSQLDSPVQIAFRETAENTTPEDLNDYRLVSGVRIPELKEPIMNLLNGLNRRQLLDILNLEILPEFWPASLSHYNGSENFNNSISNFENFIFPFTRVISSQMFDSLLVAIERNNQNWDNWRTPRLLLSLLRTRSEQHFPSFPARNRFFLFLRGRFEGAANLIDSRYGEVFDLLKRDGWVPPDLFPVQGSAIGDNSALSKGSESSPTKGQATP